MSSIEGLNKAFENRVRLGIMATLITGEWFDFNELKEQLDTTDGNLSSHITTLIRCGYVKNRKKFINNKPNTSYMITDKGRIAFMAHIAGLEEIVKKTK